MKDSPSKTLVDKEQFRTWVQEKLDDMQALIKLLMVAATEELYSAWGEVGQPGNALEILQATDKIAEGCYGLFEWKVELHFTKFPDGFECIKRMMEGWTEHLRLEMDRIPNEITKIFSDDPKPEGTFIIDLVFEAPKNIDELVPVIERLWSQ